MNLQNLVSLWQRSMQINHRSERTIKQYQYHAGKLVNWLAEAGHSTETEQITWPLLEEYVSYLSQGRAQNTVRQAVNALRSMFDYARARDEISHKSYKKIKRVLKPPTPQYNAQRTLAINEIERLINSCPDTPKGTRDAALMSLLFDSGLRAAELCRLRVDKLEYDIEISPGVIINRITVPCKGGLTEPAYFGTETRLLLDRWLAVRPAAANTPELFVGIRGLTPGRTMTTGGLRKVLRDIGNQAGISGVSPHAFRRAFAVALEMAGASTRTIKELGRWKSLQMVLLYTRDYQAALRYNDFAPMDWLKRSKK